MGIKLNPPQIEASLPPIVWLCTYKEKDESGKEVEKNKYTLTIPLYSNPSVAIGDIVGLDIIIKSVSEGGQVWSIQREIRPDEVWEFGKEIQIQQDFDTPSLIVGQYYKIQIAYLSQEKTVGHYSSVGIIKCTAKPTININDFTGTTSINGITTIFKGKYSNEKDPIEKVYSYCFTLFNANNEIIETSGVLLHNIQKDESGIESEDTWEPKIVLLDEGAQYTIKYEITTINGLRASIDYKIKPGSITPDMSKLLITHNSSENGYVSIGLRNKIPAGQYIIIRASNEDHNKWMKIKNFTLDIEKFSVDYRDYFVEQGVTYKYKIYYQLNDENETQGMFHEVFESYPVDFEDMFLSDGERQLCIRFNPKVSSFKSTILESKMDTLGGKYPFIFRNGNVNYKEFPISGLISMNMDPDSQFMTFSDISNPSNRERTAGDLAHGTDSLTNLTGNNFYKERIFKTKVLNWLTNGKPKVFRSPAEGNFIVRLMNVSLTPNDTLGRMLHTFNCTAYEVAEYNMKNVEKYNLMPSDLEWS